MKSLNFFGIKVLRYQEFSALIQKVQSLEHDRVETLNYLSVIESSKTQVVPPSTNGKSSEVMKRLSHFQEAMAQLIQSSEQTRWHDAGMAQFNQILTQHNAEQQQLFDQIVSQLARYVRANQVALFLIDNLKSENMKLRLEACYAYERKKYVTKVFDIGDNLVGQCVLERNTIFLTNVPQYYTKITSGLGEATPGCILIVPVMNDKECIGAIELASFRKFSEIEIKFIESLSRSLAASILNVKQNLELKESVARSEAAQASIREKEEEIRQQMEELQAINDEMSRKSAELEKTKEALEQKNQEIQAIRAEEKLLLEAKLDAQKNTYEMVINRLREKLSQQNTNT